MEFATLIVGYSNLVESNYFLHNRKHISNTKRDRMLTIEKLVMNTQMVDRDCHELDDKYFGQDVYYVKPKSRNSFYWYY